MTGIIITFAIGIVIMFFDYRMATAPDEKDKHKRRKPLTKVHAKNLRDLFFMTCVVAAAVWGVQEIFS